eukprot:8995282-Heterocapsa_arctica.AAC.1
MDEQAFVPLWRETSSLFPVIVDTRTTDSAASNLLCEEAREQDSPAQCLKLHVPCQIHMVSTIQGRAYTPVASTISGLVAFSLAERP